MLNVNFFARGSILSTVTSMQRPDLQKNVVGTIPKGMLETKGGVPPSKKPE